ncbi:cyclophilin-like domain-containing protein [Rhodocollybia butyracea]|uniref:peptidylprolyl isomerase n=1 Tax=Rhodocollybia butyracea TaxID=206335 RepID=A0A9P5U5X9_9AGAR|nr:cyclophilin-like domain-containing protein [Rhodocollybia butyracea]
MVRPRVFLDFAVAGDPILGRVIFELYNDTAPQASENFRVICIGAKGRNASDIFQRGDFTKRNDTPDEDSEALLCIANESQFFITLRPHLTGSHIVVGRIVRGFHEVVQKITAVPVDGPVIIQNCGELELRKPAVGVSINYLPDDCSRNTAKRTVSESESDSVKLKPSHSRSPSPPDSRRRRKKSKRKHKGDQVENGKEKKADRVIINSRGETEEEYDVRLEKEEIERLEADRRRELERIKKKYEAQSQTKDGVRFKGRGRMKYLDPDVQFR